MKRRDMLGLSDEEKIKVYEKIGHTTKGVKVREHKSGFPAVTVDYKTIHILTDCLSLEKWFAEKRRR